MSSRCQILPCRLAVAGRAAAALAWLLTASAIGQTNAPAGLLNTGAALRPQDSETPRSMPLAEQAGTNSLASVLDTSVQVPAVTAKEGSGRFLPPKKSRYNGLVALGLKKPAPKSLLQALNPFAPMPAVQAPREDAPWSVRSGWQPMPSAGLDPPAREIRGLLILSVGY